MHWDMVTPSAVMHKHRKQIAECVTAIWLRTHENRDVSMPKLYNFVGSTLISLSFNFFFVFVCGKCFCDFQYVHSVRFGSVCVTMAQEMLSYRYIQQYLPTVGVKGGLSHLQCVNVRTYQSICKIWQKCSLCIYCTFASVTWTWRKYVCLCIASPENSFLPSIASSHQCDCCWYSWWRYLLLPLYCFCCWHYSCSLFSPILLVRYAFRSHRYPFYLFMHTLCVEQFYVARTRIFNRQIIRF